MISFKAQSCHQSPTGCPKLLHSNKQSWPDVWLKVHQTCSCYMSSFVGEDRGGQEAAGPDARPRSLLKCTDQFDLAICLANETMTYGGNTTSSDEASPLMQWSGSEGGVSVCWYPAASWCGVISAALPVLLKTLSVPTCLCWHVQWGGAASQYSFWIDSVNPSERSCTRFISSPWRIQRFPPCSVTAFPGVSPLPPLIQSPTDTPAHTLRHPYNRHPSHICYSTSFTTTGC